MTVIKVEADSILPPKGVLQAAFDFSDRRESVFPAVSVKRTTVHDLGQTSADVTEGTRAGPIVNWLNALLRIGERCQRTTQTLQPPSGAVSPTVSGPRIPSPVSSRRSPPKRA